MCLQSQEKQWSDDDDDHHHHNYFLFSTELGRILNNLKMIDGHPVHLQLFKPKDRHFQHLEGDMVGIFK